MDILIKAAAVSLICVSCSLAIKSKNPELSYALTILCAVSLCISAVGMLSVISDFVISVMDKSALPSAVYVPVIKCAGIAVITKLISNLCKDAGQSGASAAVEYLGSTAAVFTALPLTETMLKTLEELI